LGGRGAGACVTDARGLPVRRREGPQEGGLRRHPGARGEVRAAVSRCWGLGFGGRLRPSRHTHLGVARGFRGVWGPRDGCEGCDDGKDPKKAAYIATLGPVARCGPGLGAVFRVLWAAAAAAAQAAFRGAFFEVLGAAARGSARWTGGARLPVRRREGPEKGCIHHHPGARGEVRAVVF
jgi:hypothetical protein